VDLVAIPKLPNKKSLEGAALAMILSGIKISHLDFQDDTRSYCLRHPVYKLRQAGWPIEDETKAGGIAKYSGRRTYYKVYFISPAKLNELKKELGNLLDKFVKSAAVFETRVSNA
jgi:hypothetical protein